MSRLRRTFVWPLLQVVVLLTVFAAAIGLRPTVDQVISPIERGGRDGRVTTRDVAVRIDGAQHARALGMSGSEATSAGRWVVVDVRVRSTREPLHLTEVWLVDADGRRFALSSRSAALTGQPSAPVPAGVDVRCQLAFEVPRDLDLRGLTLQVDPPGPTHPGERGVVAVGQVARADDDRITIEQAELA